MASAAASPNLTAIQAELPNPFTPLAFVPPTLAYQIQLAGYVLVGSLGAAIWDILSNLQLEYKMLTTGKINLPVVVYFLSRITSFGYILGSAIFETTPLKYCKATEKLVDVLYPLSFIFTCLLFFFRIRVVFRNEKWVVAFFFVLWLAVIGTNLPIINAVESANLGLSDYCINASIKEYAFVGPAVVCIHDTLVFMAISYRLMSNASREQDNIVGRAKTLAFGDYLPSFSRMLLLDGQMYFLYTIGVGIAGIILGYSTSLPTTYRTMLTLPNVFLTSSMACRIFRKVKVRGSASSDNTMMTGTIPLSLTSYTESSGRNQSVMVSSTMHIMRDEPNYGHEDSKNKSLPY